ncbi:MAG: hypothetical protein COV45_02420 [Deltaproteobacteria bacterium CG11_big_fil_rev_8_21_14_0_20_47_16]|nr:MAG: hypothetical protein COV45_02420 [Deltaproteobacteria bacterium CG11_big_fil_rev_8_21_14_0_20_47_16]
MAIGIAIAVGLVVSGCASRLSDTDDTTGATDGGADASGVDVEFAVDTFSPDSITSSDLTSRNETTDSYVESKDTKTDIQTRVPTGCVAAFELGKVKALATPCTNSAIINDLDETGAGTCSDFAKNNTFFQWGLSGISMNTPLSSTADQIALGNNGILIITGSDAATYESGIQWMTNVNAKPIWKTFAPVSLSEKEFKPSFPKGTLIYGDNVFVVTSNISFSTGKPEYDPGSVLVYSATSPDSPPKVLATQGANPTSIGKWTLNGKTYVGIINTESLDGAGDTSGTHSSLVVFDAETLAFIQKIELPFAGLGVAGEITVSDDNQHIAIPSADNSGRVVILSTNDLKATPQVATAPEALVTSGAHLISFATFIGDDHLIAGNFNTGIVHAWDISGSTPKTFGQPVTIDKNLTDYSGLAKGVCWGSRLFIANGPDIVEIQ